MGKIGQHIFNNYSRSRMNETNSPNVSISQSVAILVDGNNIERSIHDLVGSKNTMLNFDTLIPKLLGNRGLNRLFYFRRR